MRLKKSLLVMFLTSPVASSFVAAQEHLEEVTVTAHPLSEQGTSQSLSVLNGEELAEKVQGSLGETVASEAGVRSASFGSAVGRPVIHGLGGTRVKTTEDRIDSMDVAVTSTDHAVTIEPFIADQITVLRGGSTLLYGSGAIGGVVDVETGRIPKKMPEDGIEGKLEARFADNADANTVALRLDGAVGGSFAWHLDAFNRDADDYEIPGFTESQALRDAEEAEEDHEEEGHEEEGHEEEGHEEEEGHNEEEARDVLAGSFVENQGGAAGFSFIGERGFLGLAVSTLDGEYGLVGGHGHEEEGHDEGEEGHEEEEHDEEEAPGRIELEQTRFDIEAQLNDPFAGFNSLNFRLGVNDYQHQEIEGNGEVGTLFDNQAWEGRLQLSHNPLAGFTGHLGLQANNREFSAIGEEAFVQPVDTNSIGLFWVGERSFGDFDLEAGIRFETLEHDPVDSEFGKLDFDTVSASLGGVYRVSDELRLSGLIDYSGRAPSIEELYSNGPHLATQTFEIGDTSLLEEKGLGLTFTVDYAGSFFHVRSSVYVTEFDDFIYQANTGGLEDGLPVFVYQQDDATYIGLDLEADITLGEVAGGELIWSLLFDTVDAEIDVSGNQNLPRIPASRFGSGLSWNSELWQARLNLTHISSQNESANLELPSESYNDISLRVSRSFDTSFGNAQLFVQGRNLSDDEQRRHESFVKDVAPAPGRRWELGLRLDF